VSFAAASRVGAGALIIGTIIGFIFSEQLNSLLTGADRRPAAHLPRARRAFTVRLKLAVMVGVALALPIVVWQLWAFVAPGLTRRERQVARTLDPRHARLLRYRGHRRLRHPAGSGDVPDGLRDPRRPGHGADGRCVLSAS
jgi:hypothetical protein